MARKEKKVTIEKNSTLLGENSRDYKRTYLLTEMPASKAERWAARAYLALARSGAEIPVEIAQMGMVGFVLYGFKALAESKFEDLEPLMSEMMECVQIVMPTGTRALEEIDIEEVDTRGFLRVEVLHLHMGFTIADWLSQKSLTKSPRRRRDQKKSDTQTSPD